MFKLLTKLFGKKKQVKQFRLTSGTYVTHAGKHAKAEAVTELRMTVPKGLKAVTYDSPYKAGAVQIMFIEADNYTDKD